MNALRRRAKDTWNKLSLKKKLLILYMLVLVLPVGLLDAYFFAEIMRSARESTLKILHSGQVNIVQSILSKADAMEKMAETLALDTSIRTVFGRGYAKEAQRVVDYQLLTAGSVGNLLKLNPDVNAVYLHNDALLICEMAESFFSVQQSQSSALFDRLNLQPLAGVSSWALKRKGPYNLVRPEVSPERALGYQRAVTSYAGRKSAVVEVVIDKDRLFSAMYEQSLPGGGYSCIVDGSGRILFSTAKNTGGKVQELGFGDYAAANEVARFAQGAAQIALPIAPLGAALVTIVPAGSLYSGIYTTAAGVVILSLLAMALCSLLFAHFTRQLLRGIPPMMQAMHQIRQGDFSTRVPDVGGDELGRLAKDFNYMSEKLQGLVDQVYVAGQMEREAELRALEANINPHFLYNSLATITWMARAKGCGGIVEMAETLAKLYRMLLSSGRSILSFQEEMEIVRAYLKVQKIRFEDQFTAQIDVSPNAQSFPVIKNIVQPLVENALEHGIGPKLGKGLIRVCAHVEGGQLHLMVMDDGVGMSEARRCEVARGLAGDGKHGYAIRNILERLNVFYEGRYEFALHSEPGRGTTVHLALPRPGHLWKGGGMDA